MADVLENDNAMNGSNLKERKGNVTVALSS